MHIQWKWTIPNALSLLRLALIPVFAVLYLNGRVEWAIVALVVSGLSDAVDGYIARRFNQITDIGKLLDPMADKITQFVVLVCVTINNPRMWLLVAVCFVKEVAQAIGGFLLLHRGDVVRGSLWFGKVYTLVFYIVMAVFVLFELCGWVMETWLFWLLTGLVLLVMLFAFFNYLRMFLTARKSLPAPDNCEQKAPTANE